VCRRRGVLLLADNAHGAYKVFTGDHPIRLGADMTADSAHKTLPALTGTAYLHLSDSAYYEPAKKAMSMFGSSSPSYLMLDSLDLCSAYIAEKRDEALRTINYVRELKYRLASYGLTLNKSDAVRITVDANALGYTGYGLGRLLRENGAEPEMCGDRYVVLLFSVVQPERDFGRTEEILRKIPRRPALTGGDIPVIKPERRLSPREAYFAEKTVVPAAEAVGRICAGVCSPCPPCVPIVMPGELIGETEAGLLSDYGIDKIPVAL
jgi:arginine/lysine/ornithine decarboxylase